MESGSFGTIDHRNIISVKQVCLNVPEVQRCPSLPYTLL